MGFLIVYGYVVGQIASRSQVNFVARDYGSGFVEVLILHIRSDFVTFLCLSRYETNEDSEAFLLPNFHQYSGPDFA